MGAVDRIKFGIIALALSLIAARPYFAEADRAMDVKISHVAGKRLSFGDPLSVK